MQFIEIYFRVQKRKQKKKTKMKRKQISMWLAAKENPETKLVMMAQQKNNEIRLLKTYVPLNLKSIDKFQRYY